MKYFQVKWLHKFLDEPILLYSELLEDRSEVRKVEIFSNGEYGYASDDDSKGTTKLSETIWPTEDEIVSEPQFVLCIICQEEFEEVWNKAHRLD